jgi:copper(I)-binding protein
MAAAGPLTIVEPWVRAADAEMTAGYMMITNSGETDDALVTASSPIATVEIHETIVENEIARMRPIDSLVIPAQGMTELKPGGAHLMFIGLTEPLNPDDTVEITLTFESGAVLKLTVPVRDAGMMPAMDMDHGG